MRIDERPSKAQFHAMPHHHRQGLLKAVDQSGNHFTPEAKAEVRAARLARAKAKAENPRPAKAVHGSKSHTQKSAGIRRNQRQA